MMLHQENIVVANTFLKTKLTVYGINFYFK